MTYRRERTDPRMPMVPRENERDLEDLPSDVRAAMNIKLADNADEVLDTALLPERQERTTSLAPVE